MARKLGPAHLRAIVGIRTVQRRLKGWRSEQARAFVFSGNCAPVTDGAADAAAKVDSG
jgi:hypothetical protein